MLFYVAVFVIGMIAETFLGWGSKIRNFVKEKI